MSDQFSDIKAPREGGFQRSSDQNFKVFAFKEPNSRNPCDQHSERNIPTQNYRSLSSLSQLPTPPLPPPPLPPRLCGPNFSPGNLFPYPPLSNYPPLSPMSNTCADFPISLGQPNFQNPDFSKPPPPPPPPKPPFSFPPQNLLLRQPICEINNEDDSFEGDQVTSTNQKLEDVNLKGSPEGFDQDKDELFVQNWLSNVRKRLIGEEESGRKTKEIKIKDAQKKLLRYAILIKELKELMEDVSDLPSTSDLASQKYKERLMIKANELKADIEELKRYFSEETLNKIKESLSKRREKRLKRRKTKGERNERWKKRKEEWKRLSEEIDEKIKMENEEEKQKLEEEKMKREADTVLREVRSKQEDVIRMQKLLQSLKSLRDIRKNKGEMHGYVENSEASSFFDKMKMEFETILSEQEKIYCSEEQTLKIMIEESQSSTLSFRKRRPLFAPNLKEIKRNIYQIYFGKERPRIEEEKEYERSFLAAEESAEILVQRRKDWDQFLVGDNSGSSIPIGWVLPNLNPNSDWKSYQES